MPMLDVYIHNQDAPGLVDACLLLACRSQASDLHIEPRIHGWQIRQRVDGLLHPVVVLPQSLGKAFIVRVKLLARLDIGEQRKPQDGSFQINLEQNQLDIRCSILPGYLGEKLVLRIQHRHQQTLLLDALGMSEKQLHTLQSYLQLPQGLIMVTGPTGAGKTITLYAALQNLLQPQRNIMSVEDPVELLIPGMHQVAPNERIGFNFAKVLRALLRQDPDAIMLGELRDGESADMAIKAAQTGHLVLTSMHTNTALEAISRCFGLGIDLKGFSYCVQLVINQRLLRRLCEHCKEPLHESQLAQLQTPLWRAVAANYNGEFGDVAPAQAVGCEYCYGGYKGRFGVFELWPVLDCHRSFIAQGDLPGLNAEQGLTYQAMIRVLVGQTSIQELKRVIV